MEGYERRLSAISMSPAAADHWRSNSPSGSERRKLSFHPVGEWVPPVVTTEEPVGAIEVGKTKRLVQVGVAVTYCLLAAGVVFGFAAFKPVLVEEGVYHETCTQDEHDRGEWVCYEQELRLNLMFTVAAVSTNVCALPVGTILDRYGPRVASLIGVAFLTLGSLSLALANDLSFDAYIPGYLFLALGGPFVFIPSFQLSNTFPAHSGLILALLTGAFDTSSAVFLFYRLIYQVSNGWFTPRKFFLLYLIVPAFIFTAQLFIMPSQSYRTVDELTRAAEDSSLDTHDSGTEIDDASRRAAYQQRRESRLSEATSLLSKNSNGNGAKQAQQDESKVAISGVWGALHGKTALQQIVSPWFVLITLFTVVQMTRINYFVATVRTQYDYLLHSHDGAAQINGFFDVALPLGGVIAVPFIGLVLDHTSTPFTLALLVSIATAIGIFGIIPELWAGYVNVSLFVVYRPLYYTAVSDYSAKVFGFATFGKVLLNPFSLSPKPLFTH